MSKEPAFADKVADIVGLYLDPPGGAVVLSLDEKTQIQALDRTQPLLPTEFDRSEQRTHDYVRHGTTNLFAALNVGTGEVIGDCVPSLSSLDTWTDLSDQVPSTMRLTCGAWSFSASASARAPSGMGDTAMVQAINSPRGMHPRGLYK
ncbi:hypothetical protein CLV70_1041 [Pseudosporangium ferrugineum]|uniref:DDE superfamily endonuclease n=1 Tax=Pseudosporangium ferrugineum TaxID=439699 RepID=A0A2T0SAJ9_9ACTN|nr:hypothetical protein CLV70_1041 [Pseudosporangium ferrugineum]